jgi:hypothetical protein
MSGRSSVISHCRSCGARGIWMTSTYGKKVLVELASCSAEDRRGRGPVFDPKRHVAHFAKCPQADQWRRPANRSKPE